MIHKKFLLLIAGLVWLGAGINIFRIGVTARVPVWNLWMIVTSFTILLLFHFLVFRRMVKKHTRRIHGYLESRQPFYRFFNKQSYGIMAFMMTFGIGLRVSGIVSDTFIAVFYTGLGTSLLLAGVSFIYQFARYPHPALTKGEISQ